MDNQVFPEKGYERIPVISHSSALRVVVWFMDGQSTSDKLDDSYVMTLNTGRSP